MTALFAPQIRALFVPVVTRAVGSDLACLFSQIRINYCESPRRSVDAWLVCVPMGTMINACGP